MLLPNYFSFNKRYSQDFYQGGGNFGVNGGGCQIINLPRFLSTDNNVYWKFGLVLHIFMQFWKACPWLCSGLGAFIACYCRGGWALACPRPSPVRFPKWFDFYMTHSSNYENKTNNNHRRIKLNSKKFCYLWVSCVIMFSTSSNYSNR